MFEYKVTDSVKVIDYVMSSDLFLVEVVFTCAFMFIACMFLGEVKKIRKAAEHRTRLLSLLYPDPVGEDNAKD